MPDPEAGTPQTAPPVPTQEERRQITLRNMLERAAGGTLETLSRKYKVKPSELKALLEETLKDEIVESLREQVLTELVPMALAVLEARLKMGDIDAAKYLLDNFGVAKRPAQSIKVQPIVPPASDIEAYRLERQTRQYKPQRLITPADKDQVN